jgi:hypothetical protein
MTEEIVDRYRSSTPWTADYDKKAMIPQATNLTRSMKLDRDRTGQLD